MSLALPILIIWCFLITINIMNMFHVFKESSLKILTQESMGLENILRSSSLYRLWDLGKISELPSLLISLGTSKNSTRLYLFRLWDLKTSELPL